MEYIGLLTDKQKRAGLFVAQDEDFIYLFYRDGYKGKQPRLLKIFLYETARVKEIREEAEQYLSASP